MKKVILLFLLVGCSENSTPPIPPSNGDFVRNSNGVGAARVFGIDFSVAVNSSGAGTDTDIHADFVEPDESSAMKRFTLGDDVRIQLDSIDESQVRFTFNDQDFGILSVGDKVVIDKERNVEVNGTQRLTNRVE